jgi:hypothetical protein
MMSEHEESTLEVIRSTVEETKGQVRDIWQILNGANGSLGITQKVAVMWRAHVVIMCSISALVSAVGTASVLKVLGLLK